MERILLVVILFKETNWTNILLLILYSLLVIISSFRLTRHWTETNKKRKKFLVTLLILIFLFAIPITKSFYLLIFLLILEWIIVLKNDSRFYLDDLSIKNHKVNFGNYFFTAVAKERYFYFNTVASIFFIGLLFFQDLPTILKFPMLFTVASMNTPLTTLISGTPQMKTHLQSLPNSFIVYNMYLQCLISYFFITNTLVASLYIYSTHNLYILIWVWTYTILEAASYLFLEKYITINHWNIKKELWKHPRKYIIPLLTYLFFFFLFS
ncbi:hypothetical protein [Streptococcus dentiloxodontae]